MSENLVSRVKRLVSGSVAGMVDAIENATPETVMKEAIREVERATDQVRDELGVVIANKHVANTRLMNANAKHEELADQIELAINQGRDDLAQAAISRQLDLEAQIPILEAAINDATHEEAELDSYIAALNGRRREMEEELSTLQSQRSRAASNDVMGNASAADQAEHTASRAENAFNRAMRSTSTTPGVAGGDRHTSAKLAELEKLSRENRVQERLAAVKASRRDTDT